MSEEEEAKRRSEPEEVMTPLGEVSSLLPEEVMTLLGKVRARGGDDSTRGKSVLSSQCGSQKLDSGQRDLAEVSSPLSPHWP